MTFGALHVERVLALGRGVVRSRDHLRMGAGRSQAAEQCDRGYQRRRSAVSWIDGICRHEAFGRLDRWACEGRVGRVSVAAKSGAPTSLELGAEFSGCGGNIAAGGEAPVWRVSVRGLHEGVVWRSGVKVRVGRV